VRLHHPRPALANERVRMQRRSGSGALESSLRCSWNESVPGHHRYQGSPVGRPAGVDHGGDVSEVLRTDVRRLDDQGASCFGKGIRESMTTPRGVLMV
jgi:hypothetical protein